MIQKNYGKFIPVCNRCDAELPPEDTWEDARDAMRDENWYAVKENDEWANCCPGCYHAE